MANSYRAAVLVVDDEQAIRESLRMILEFEGYRVDEAPDGATALRHVAERRPDAMLLDIKMPELDGMAVLRDLRERGYDVPVLMITGHGDVQTALEATRRGRLRLSREAARPRSRPPVAAQRRRVPTGCSASRAGSAGSSTSWSGRRRRCGSCARPSSSRRRPRPRC